MTLTVHHLGISQSERIPWLCEELGIPYTLKKYDRDQTGMAPADYKALSPMGIAPVITDRAQNGEEFVLGESGAIIDYIITKYGNGRLREQGLQLHRDDELRFRYPAPRPKLLAVDPIQAIRPGEGGVIAENRLDLADGDTGGKS